MRLIAKILVAIAVSFVIALVTAWAVLALWYRLPLPEFARGGAGGFLVLLGLATIVALFTRMRIPAVAVFLAVFGAILIWWNTIRPPEHANWAREVAQQVSGTRNGDLLTLSNVRDFEWRSKTDFTERWATRTYDLTKLQTVDLFMSYWGNPNIAHVMLSFGFEGGDYIAWSIEVRRRIGGEFSPVADLFKSDPLVIIASDERDVVSVRSNFRQLKQIVNDEKVTVRYLDNKPRRSPASPLDSELFKAAEVLSQSMWPGVPVIPAMGAGATDSSFLRNAGIPMYGVSGLFVEAADYRTHGLNERIEIQRLYDGREFLYRLVKQVSQ